jgi:hypothetical protein
MVCVVRILAHRANYDGPGSGENSRDALDACVSLGFEVELDIWARGEVLWVGHDDPLWPCDPAHLRSIPVLAHAKNIEAAAALAASNVPFFCLDGDDFGMCSTGEIWTNYGAPAVASSIVCSPELVGADEPITAFLARHRHVAGVCTDHPIVYRELTRP